MICRLVRLEALITPFSWSKELYSKEKEREQGRSISGSGGRGRGWSRGRGIRQRQGHLVIRSGNPKPLEAA